MSFTNSISLRTRFLHISAILPICFVFQSVFLAQIFARQCLPQSLYFVFLWYCSLSLSSVGAWCNAEHQALACGNGKVYRFLFCSVVVFVALWLMISTHSLPLAKHVSSCLESSACTLHTMQTASQRGSLSCTHSLHSEAQRL